MGTSNTANLRLYLDSGFDTTLTGVRGPNVTLAAAKNYFRRPFPTPRVVAYYVLLFHFKN